MEFPLENGAASHHYITLGQWLVIIQMQFVLAVGSIKILLEYSAQYVICELNFNSKVLAHLAYHVCLIPYFASFVWLAVLCISVCQSFLTCVCLIFHLRNKKQYDLTELYLLLPCPIMDFPFRYIHRSSYDLSQRAWIPLNMSLHSLFPPPLLLLLPLLLAFLEYLLLSDLMKEFN